MSLRKFFVQGDEPRPKGNPKAEARIAALSTGELRDYIEQYLYIVGRSLTEYSKDPTNRALFDEAVDAGRLLNLCLEAMACKL